MSYSNSDITRIILSGHNNSDGPGTNLGRHRNSDIPRRVTGLSELL